ncbi:hypothetical protein J7E50_10710 [Pedobacter sp. ISL-68]|uniref:hypothetical protein n=1 Tax=unclassified Pedobacter TaxID=2628915 RepID=UPI001BEC6EA9|nr:MULTISPECIES: hypothetical protein [unclassified Pedobacter]MBT2561301.1 hypothetical protein [Pedobacter sp. ISL-64]MBT2590691.1 hypothetical protein [Pedobacter sp. ISL-68]
MGKYMGYKAEAKVVSQDGVLPTVDISGVQFYADIIKHEFRQVSNPSNRISMGGIKEQFGFSHFLFDRRTKNIYTGDPKGNIPEHVDIILVPPVKDIDPVGLARRYGYREDHFTALRNRGDLVLTSLRKVVKNGDEDSLEEGKEVNIRIR